MPRPRIDRDKLRAAVRTLGDEHVFYMLDEAIDLLPEAKLAKIARRYIDPARLQPDGSAKRGLLAEVKAFEQASLRGEYYEGFNVNSKNFMDKSRGTRAWISECHRLLDRCVGRAKTHAPPGDVRAAPDRDPGAAQGTSRPPDRPHARVSRIGAVEHRHAGTLAP